MTASDDATLKIFDFGTGEEVSTISGHNWDVKSVDWNPVKGLLVSGSKDHLVKLWDPRTGRCLTTIHGHKNTISRVLFEPQNGDMFASCARDQTARVFDLRMMRDVVLLKGHEKDITTITWHPVHRGLISTGGLDGSLHHYVLDEQHPPAGVERTISPYDSMNPEIHPTQQIWPAHKVSYAHDLHIWSLDWHPLGHILASSSNDRVTRFWGRARPGETECFNDRYHIGEQAAESLGTWDRGKGRRMQREEEEQELEDEAEGLVDQKMPAKQPTFPGLPGLPGLQGLPLPSKDGTSIGGAQLLFPGMGSVLPPPLPPSNGLPGLSLPGLSSSKPPDLAQLAAMMGGALPPLPPPPPPGMNPGQAFPPPPPALLGQFPGGVLPPGLIPPGFPMPPNLASNLPIPPPPPPPPPPPQVPAAIPERSNGTASGSGSRKRAPLPSQAESLASEQRKGKFRHAR